MTKTIDTAALASRILAAYVSANKLNKSQVAPTLAMIHETILALKAGRPASFAALMASAAPAPRSPPPARKTQPGRRPARNRQKRRR